MANVINSLKLGDGTYVFTTPYATCSTAAGEVAKVATITPGSNFSLETGARVAVKFANANATSAPTLNVNSTGAKPIYFKNATITSSLNFWSAGQIVEFIYDGTNWNYSAAVSNTDTKDTTGSSNTSSKIFLVGATSQASSSTTYSHDTVYIGTDGCLNVRSADSDNERMIVAGTSIKKVTPVGTYEYGFPSLASGNSATIALTSDIPDVSNFVTSTVLSLTLDNYVDLSSAQTISGKKTFTGGVQFGTNTVFNNGGIQIPAANAFKVMGMYDVSLPSKSGTLATTGDIPSTSSFVTVSGDQTISGAKTFTGRISIEDESEYGSTCDVFIEGKGSISYHDWDEGTDLVLNMPITQGETRTYTIATTNDVNNILTGSNTYTGITTFNSTTYFKSGVFSTSYNDTSNYAHYAYDSITRHTSTVNYKLTLPTKTGTIALTSDIPSGGSGDVTAAGNNTFTGSNKFQGGTTSFMSASGRPGDPVTIVDSDGVHCQLDGTASTSYKDNQIQHKAFTLTLPYKSGTLATTSDIPIKSATLSGTTLSITLS